MTATNAHRAKAAAALNAKTIGTGYAVEYRPLVHRRGWPEPSAKPFHLVSEDGPHLAAFASLAALEANWRARAAC